MSHADAPLTPAGRLRLIDRCATRPIAHIAAGAGVSRQYLSTWKNRYDTLGEVGLLDRSSAPHTSPTQTDGAVVAHTEPLTNETAKTAIGFFARARALFRAHGIGRIGRIARVITDNGACYRAATFTRSPFDASRHRRTRPFTPTGVTNVMTNNT